MSNNKARDQRRDGRGTVEARRRRRMRPTVVVLEDRRLLSTFTVTNNASSGAGSLPYEIGLANTAGGANTIVFGSFFNTPQTITLGGTQLELSTANESVTIAGPAAGVTVSGNNASRVFLVDPTVTASISGLTISGGTTTGDGGGLENFGTTTLTNCTVSGNSAGFRAGGLYNGGTLTMTNCTVSGNSADFGAGVYNGTLNNLGPTAMLTNCTVSGNSGYLGGLSTQGAPVTLTNTIVAENAGADIYAALSSLSGTNNLIGTGAAGGLTNGVNGNLVGVTNPLLAPLGNYGGPTQTVALLPGSPAINAGTNGPGIPTTDQRGLGRVGAVDIGAFESQGFTLTVVAGSSPQTSNIGTAFANPLAVSVTANNPVEPVNGGVVTFVAKPASTGASAFFPASSAVVANGVIANGQAAVTAAPNNMDGSYHVVASASGSSPATFNLTNTGPVFTHLIVNTTSDSLFPGVGLLSLREAIAFANADSLGNSNITFDSKVFGLPQTITLTGTQLELSNTSETETITGPNKGVTVSGGGLSRVFQVDPGVTASISGLTITGGGNTYYGGGLYNEGATTLTNCTVSGNSAFFDDGGLCNGGSILFGGGAAGMLTLTNCNITGNSASINNSMETSGAAGGLFTNPSSTTTLTNCTVSGNSARLSGGGVYNFGRTTLTNCTVSGNHAGGSGGGVNSSRGGALHYEGTTTLTDCTVSGNSADGTGGGVYNLFGAITLTNCTVSRNSAVYGGGGIGNNGGGRYSNNVDTIVLTNCTVSGNSVRTGGGGVQSVVGGSATLTDCTVSGNSAAGNGGGVSTDYSFGLYHGATKLTNCTVSGNSAAGNGGGLYNYSLDSTTLTGVSVKGNSAVAGGGIYNQGTLNVSSSNVINNQATSKGGGISTTAGSATITDSVINANQVNSSVTALGGGIDSENSTLSLNNCTVNANQANGATALGGGIYALGSTVDVENSTVNGNQANGTVLGEGGGIYSFNSVLTLVATNVKGNKATTSYDDIFNGP